MKNLITTLIAIVSSISLILLLVFLYNTNEVLTINTPQDIYYVNTRLYIIGAESNKEGEIIKSFTSYSDLDDWLSNRTAIDANIVDVIPDSSQVFGGTYNDGPLPVIKWREGNKQDTIGYLYIDYGILNYIPKNK